MTIEKISFTNEAGLKLAARLDRPPTRAPIAYALFAHCFTCTKHSKAAATIGRTLAEAGLAVLRFDFAGLGESEGLFDDTTFSSNVDDLLAAAAFLARHRQPAKILIGHSLGGAAVLRAAPRLPEAAGVVTIGAPADPRHLGRLMEAPPSVDGNPSTVRLNVGGRRLTVNRQFLDDLEKAPRDGAIARIDKALLIFHSPMDQVVGIDHAARLFQAARHPKSFVSLDQADHLLSNPADAVYAAMLIAAWARKYIQAPVNLPQSNTAEQNH